VPIPTAAACRTWVGWGCSPRQGGISRTVVNSDRTEIPRLEFTRRHLMSEDGLVASRARGSHTGAYLLGGVLAVLLLLRFLFVRS
jgi:hypothetical protein